MTGSERPDPGLVASCLDDLERLWHHGSLGHPAYSDEPLDGLVLTILSQNTNDKNRDRAFGSLKTRFPSWDRVASASWEEVAESIRSGGIANVKARRILSVLELVRQRFGEYSLKKLTRWSDGETRDYLESIPGVGPKTAACVLLFDLGRPAFPVDTHVARVAKRLGWVPQNTPPAKIQQIMEETVKVDRYLAGHLNIITHGRHICRAIKPLCGDCPISDRCHYHQEGKEK